MYNERLSYTPERTTMRLALPFLAFALLVLISWVIHVVGHASSDLAGHGDELYWINLLWGILCGVWFLNVLLPPRLSVDTAGVTWTRLGGLLRRSIRWNELTEVATISEPCDHENCSCLTYHLTLRSGKRKIHIESGLIVEEEDLQRIAAIVSQAISSQGIRVEVSDETGWLGAQAGAS